MRIVVGLAAALAAIAAFAGPQAETALACSCAYPNLARELPRADAAFVGTVLSSRIANSPGVRFGNLVIMRFSLQRAIKGSLTTPLVVRTSAQESACGLRLRRGDRAGLLLDRHAGAYFTSVCSQVYPERLIRHALPRARVIAAPKEGTTGRWWLVLAAGVVLIVLGSATVAYRRFVSSGRPR